MTAYAAQLPPNTFAVLDATGNWSHIYDVLSRQVEQVELAHPRQVRAIAAVKVKTDKLDATCMVE